MSYRKPAEGATMNSTTIIAMLNALGLEADATEDQALEKIADLKDAAADEDELAERDELELIKRGEHEQVAANDDGSLTVTFLYPLKSGKETIDSVVMRRPKMKHLRAMDKEKGDMAQTQALLASCCGRSSSEFTELDKDDMLVLGAALRFFSRKRRRTGAAS